MKNCMKCGGAIFHPNAIVGYAGPICYCPRDQHQVAPDTTTCARQGWRHALSPCPACMRDSNAYVVANATLNGLMGLELLAFVEQVAKHNYSLDEIQANIQKAIELVNKYKSKTGEQNAQTKDEKP